MEQWPLIPDWWLYLFFFASKKTKQKQCVRAAYFGLAIYIKEYHLKAKEELEKLKYFSIAKI